ncbi:FAD-binding domain-containing protein [Roseofilum casamattae]|uniref:FAD-binding domain-containing protein n=1 Tax=Roseofilum casamattae BLCC-M143 TaxID=3022442 RepID=A0ABT7BR21_9CYAN|nr:FAD-binding domain-containing protein [Roseofilum casamattae]MDJ1181652.1 FAD-binding domain-containing protein [Roseofilum casamattae BLCC-M143]
MSRLSLFWHRRDLRVRDNVGLNAAWQKCDRLVGCFCFDPNILVRQDIAARRLQFLVESLHELQETYQQLNYHFLILWGKPEELVPDLAAGLNAASVVWNRDVEPYSQMRDARVAEALKHRGIKTEQCWDSLLVSPDEIRTKAGNPYTVYTPFWKNWSGKEKHDAIALLPPGTSLTENEENAIEGLAWKPIPTLADLGFSRVEKLEIAPGETAARSQLQQFCDRALTSYGDRRNIPGDDGTSQLSPALKFGTIGIREVWQKTVEVMARSSNEEERENIQIWQKELAWREFYQHVLYHFPELADGPYREPFKQFPWNDNRDYFQAWCAGKTGYPIVDAAMHQLNETGWMHNRCRMIVASFLTKDLMLNWQWGEQYFMQTLIDGDLAANNGGWQWSASSGMDPKPLRIFNPASQAQKFDPQGKYIRRWLPQLRSLNTKSLLTGNILPLVRQSCNYPAPIVNHNEQQREFKQRYQQVSCR